MSIDRTRRASARLDLSRPPVVALVLPVSLHRFAPLPAPDLSDGALLIWARYGTAAGVFYEAYNEWPRFAAPGCACGLEVMR